MSWTAITTSWIQQVVTALQPVMVFVSPIAIVSIFLYFIRSFFD